MSLTFVDESGHLVLSETAWCDTKEAIALEVGVAAPRDNTDYAKKVSTRAVHDQYVSRGVTFSKRVGNVGEEMSCLPLTEVRILKQDPAPTGKETTYGTKFVRMAIMSNLVSGLRAKLARTSSVASPPVYREMTKEDGGHNWTIFTANLDGATIEVEGKDGRYEVPLSDILGAGETDVKASVAFKVDLKYAGPKVDVSTASYSLQFSPLIVFPYSHYSTSLDPHPAGIAKVSTAAWPRGVSVSGEMLGALSRLGIN
jgi:hypothetical protein